MAVILHLNSPVQTDGITIANAKGSSSWKLTMQEALTPFPLPMVRQVNGRCHYQPGPP